MILLCFDVKKCAKIRDKQFAINNVQLSIS
jgi:hypothetical protein